jgi:hypothetical protein
VLVMTPEALHSPWVMREVDAAFVRVNAGRMQNIIPLMAQSCSEQDIPPLLSPLQRYDATKGYEAALAGLLRALGLSSIAPVAQSSFLPASLPSKPSAPKTWVVDASGGGDYNTIRKAVQIAKSRDRIVVRPGIYSRQLTINKPLELVGEGDRDVIVVEASDEVFLPNFVPSFFQYSVIRVRAMGVHHSNVSVRVRPRTRTDSADAILVEGGGELRIDECDITSSVDSNSGVWIRVEK